MEAGEYQRKDVRRGVDHIGVTVVFFCHDGAGRVLLHKRSANCRDEQGRWDCGGGALEFGETFEDAVCREVREEYLVNPLEYRFIEARNVLREHAGQPTHWVAIIYAVRVDAAAVGIGEPHKMDEIGWFTPDTLPDPLHSQLMPHFAIVRQLGIL